MVTLKLILTHCMPLSLLLPQWWVPSSPVNKSSAFQVFILRTFWKNKFIYFNWNKNQAVEMYTIYFHETILYMGDSQNFWGHIFRFGLLQLWRQCFSHQDLTMQTLSLDSGTLSGQKDAGEVWGHIHRCTNSGPGFLSVYGIDRERPLPGVLHPRTRC